MSSKGMRFVLWVALAFGLIVLAWAACGCAARGEDSPAPVSGEPKATPTAQRTLAPTPSPTPAPTPVTTPEPTLYYTPEYREETSVNAKGKTVTLIDDMVDIRRYDTTIVIDMIFATDRNFTGEVLYGAPACLMQRDLAIKLHRAQMIFLKDGFSLKIYDAYRPHSVQHRLSDAVGSTRYIADPSNASKHNRGCAVDVTLVDADGDELEMPSAMHTFDSTAHRKNSAMTEAARANLDYLTGVLVECGLETYAYEWWHYVLPDYAGYLVTDYDLAAIPLAP